jgi:ATP-binding cassette subfamily B protein/subfamily B ATP-binding cassette protein MsbA
VESVFQKKTFSTWIAEEITNARARQVKLADESAVLETQLAATTDVRERSLIEQELEQKSGYQTAEHKAVEWYEWIRPSVERYAPKSPFGTLVAAMVWLLIASALKGVFLILGSLFVARIANGTARDMRRIYYRKALEMDQLKFDRMGTSSILTHLSHNMMLISGGLTMLYGKSIREPLKMFTCLLVAAWISLPLLLISLALVPLGAWVVHRLASGMKNATRREVLGMADIFDTLIETLSSIKTVRMFNRESTERKRFKANSEMLYRMAMRMRFFDAMVHPITELLGIVSITLAILAGAWLTLSGELTLLGITISNRPLSPAKLMLFYGMLAGASDPARKLSEIVNVLVRGGTACESLVRSYDSIPTVTAPAVPLSVPEHSVEIELDNVLFAYQPKQPVLKNISLKIPFRQTLAIVGENGCGKSTLINLLARFYDPNVGRILVDGVDIRQMNPKKLRRQMAWVTQESNLFRGTVWENIAYGLRNASREQVLNAVHLAQVDKFLDQLPLGLDSDVGEGGNSLSAGQRQRVALARAILADPRILILDEATSQLDGHTEQLVHRSLGPFIKSRTTLIITHRLSTISLADRVIVMDKGKIVSDSTPDQAIQSSTQFNHLFAKKSA